jgi:hypothetical protein
MKSHRHVIWLAGLAGLACLLAAADGAPAQERSFMVEPKGEAPAAVPPQPYGCNGRITRVMDIGFEGVKTTTAIYGTNPGGGEGGQFDKTPIFTAQVKLADGACLNAHLSAIVGSKQTYNRSPITVFQVTLTGLAPSAPPRHMFGHYETPWGHAPSSPAVALEAERDVDMFAANFFQRVGKGPHDVPPGAYRVDVWWAGGPAGVSPGGAIGAAFVLKLYMQQ